jgi:CheY-like chemotaxis protein
VCAGSAMSLAESAADASFDVVVADADAWTAENPGWSGHWRNHAERCKTPVILLVSPGGTGRETAVLNAPAARLSKPVRRRALLEALLFLKKHPGGALPEAAAQRLEPIGPVAVARNLRVLLAEDHPVNQRLAVLMLRRFGIQADVAGNGLEAIEALRRQPYDLVLMDVQMPELDGLEATRRIRETIPASAQPRIVALTAGVAQFDEKACRAAGMDGFLAKPFKPEALAAVLEACAAVDARR